MFVFLAIGLWVHTFLESSDDGTPNESITKTIIYRFRVQNNGSQPVFGSCFSTVAPIEKTSSQSCTKIEASHPFSLVTDTKGNRILAFTFDAFPPYASKFVSIKATLTLAATPTSCTRLGACEQIQRGSATPKTSNRRLHALAMRLASDEARHTANNIYQWIVDNITYAGYSATSKGAGYAFSAKQGDCTEFADLFVALALSTGLPARRVSGYMVPASAILTSTSAHDWAEFYDNGVWRIADAQQKNFDAKYMDYVAMRIHESSSSNETDPSFYRYSVKGKGMTAQLDS